MAKIHHFSLSNDSTLWKDIEAIVPRHFASKSEVVRTGLETLLKQYLDNPAGLDSFLSSSDTLALPSLGMGRNDRIKYMKNASEKQLSNIAESLENWNTDFKLLQRNFS